jgi:hypothetical protein
MIRSHGSSSQTNLDHLNGYQGDTFSAVQSIFSGVTCYQLLANSNKAIVFETSIPFQLAFFALVEHDTDVAPLWDPARRQFVGLMTISDYVQALQVCRRQGISMLDLSTRSITGLPPSPLAVEATADAPTPTSTCRPCPMCPLPLAPGPSPHTLSAHADMLSSPAMTFRHPEYQTLDAEDTIQQLCLHLHR